MVGKSGEVMEDLSTVFALVDLVAPVGVNVGAEVVPSGIATPTDVAGKGFLPRVDSHVTAEVSGTDELTPTYLAGVGSLGLHPRVPIPYLLPPPTSIMIDGGGRGGVVSVLKTRPLIWLLTVGTRRCHGSQQV